MTALPILLTDAGWEAFTAAQLQEDINLEVAEIGFTATDFVMARTLTALPGEFKRLATLSGAAVGIDVVHLTVSDSSADTYEMRGFGLFLADGTLFAVYGQPDLIVEKSTVSSLLVALDIKFLPALVSEIVFGNANFLYPPATETTKGVAEIATQAEVDAGTDAERIVTPKTLFARFGNLLQRKILGAGLATGGGDLTADRTITVTPASAAEADAGAIATKALTPASLVNILSSIAARALSATTITGSGLVTGGGSLAANRVVTVTAATAAEADAGAIATKALTPASLANILGSIAAKAIATRQILTSGLATGGGNLTADRTIDVPKASAAEVQVGTNDTKAITPLGLASFGKFLGTSGYCRFPGGLLLQWGRDLLQPGVAGTVSFPIQFPTACDTVIVSPGQLLGDVAVVTGSISQPSFQADNNLSDPGIVLWIAIGH